MKASAWAGLLFAAVLCRQAAPALCADIVDVQSGAPVGNAWVVFARTECLGFGHCSTRCVEVHAVKSNDAGEIRVRGFNPGKMDKSYVYKAGYDYRGTQDNIHYLDSRRSANPYTNQLDDVSARIYILGRDARSSVCDGASFAQRGELIPFYKDLFAEAWKIAQLPEHRADAIAICGSMFSMSERQPYTDSPANPQRVAFFAQNQPECNEKIDLSERDRFFGLVRGHMTSDVGRMLSGEVTPAIKSLRVNPALVTASKNSDFEMMRLLLSRGADPNVADLYGAPLVSQLLESPTPDLEMKRRVVEHLLKAGADPNRRDNSGFTPLHRVVKKMDGYAISFLLHHGADAKLGVSCNLCVDNGLRPLQYVRSAEVAKLLTAAGADVNAVDDRGQTALHGVVNADVARVLIENGANVNAQSANGWTPLMYALVPGTRNREYRDIAKLMVQRGAKLELTNKEGKDALFYARDEAFEAELRALADANKK